MVNVFGGKGFVGSKYASKYECIVNDRNDLEPKSFDILYMISTVDNYSMKVNPFIDIETNLTTLMRVLEKCKGKDITFNFASSWFVYGDTDLPAREDSHCNPKGFYSITKRTAEQLLMTYCENFGIKYRILRFANVIGDGDLKVSKKKNALTYLVNEMKAGNDINLYDDGDFYRDYIHVEDLCDAINLIIEKGELNTIYNIGSGEQTKFRSLIDYAMYKTKSKSKLINVEQAEYHKLVQVKSMYMECSKLKSLGFTPKYSPLDIIDSIV